MNIPDDWATKVITWNYRQVRCTSGITSFDLPSVREDSSGARDGLVPGDVDEGCALLPHVISPYIAHSYLHILRPSYDDFAHASGPRPNDGGGPVSAFEDSVKHASCVLVISGPSVTLVLTHTSVRDDRLEGRASRAHSQSSARGGTTEPQLQLPRCV